MLNGLVQSRDYPLQFNPDQSFNENNKSLNGNAGNEYSRTAVFGTKEENKKQVQFHEGMRENSFRNENPTFGGHEASREEIHHEPRMEHFTHDLSERERGIFFIFKTLVNSAVKYRSLRCPYEGFGRPYPDGEILSSPEGIPPPGIMHPGIPINPYRR